MRRLPAMPRCNSAILRSCDSEEAGMPISDAYVVQYLVQETTASQNPLQWHEHSDAYATTVNGVTAQLHRISDRAGTRLYVTLESRPERIEISEPIEKGFFHPNYDSE